MEDLVQFARDTFRLDLPGEDGVALRDKLDHLGRAPQTAELPVAAAHVWDWFAELNAGRTSNGFGPNALSFIEISAWCSLTGRVIRPWEVQAIKAVDMAYLEAVGKQNG